MGSAKKYTSLLFFVRAEHGALLFSMLTDLDEDLDAAAEKMGMVMGSLAKLLKTKGASVSFTRTLLSC